MRMSFGNWMLVTQYSPLERYYRKIYLPLGFRDEFFWFSMFVVLVISLFFGYRRILAELETGTRDLIDSRRKALHADLSQE